MPASLPIPSPPDHLGRNVNDILREFVGNSTNQQTANPLPFNVASGPHAFQGAHDFAIQNLQMFERFIQIFQTGETVLRVLDQKRIPGIEFDSSVRQPPPRCHPETRKELRTRLIYWLLSSREDWRMIWLSGPAGVGKSAVAQTFAEYCDGVGQLGAAFFFSRLYGRNDPYRVIPSLAYQLAVHYPAYKDVITKVLADDPSVPDKTLRVQFRKLITEPFTIINGVPDAFNKPLVIIIDGLDECDGDEPQCEFVEIISEYVRTNRPPQARLLWLICSRPEWHLKRIFSRAHFRISCRRETLACDAAVDKQDVYCVLKDGLAEVHEKFYWELDQRNSTPWPSEPQLQRLADVVDGYFIVAFTLLNFIGDKEYGDPIGRLNTCLSLLGDTFTPMSLNPLHSLDIIYRQILSTVPPHILPTTKRIFALCVFYPTSSSALFARDMANFLCLEKTTFYRALRNVHSVVDIPEERNAHLAPLKFYHLSFREFLLDENRSGQFALNEAEARLDIASLCLRWYNLCIQPRCSLKAGECGFANADIRPTWVKDETKAGIEDALFRIQGFVEEECWTAACLVFDDQKPLILEEIRKFNFCHLTLLREPLPIDRLTKFEQFIECFWRMEFGPNNMTIIRLEPVCVMDMMLLDTLVERTSMGLSSKDSYVATSYFKGYFVSAHHLSPLPPPATLWCAAPMNLQVDVRGLETPLTRKMWSSEWFWIGEEERTALATFRCSKLEPPRAAPSNPWR